MNRVARLTVGPQPDLEMEASPQGSWEITTLGRRARSPAQGRKRSRVERASESAVNSAAEGGDSFTAVITRSMAARSAASSAHAPAANRRGRQSKVLMQG